MVTRPFEDVTPAIWAIHLHLSHGRHGATARVEWRTEGTGTWAVLALDGWVEKVALKRLTGLLEQLADLGARRVLLDGTRLRYIDYALIPSLLRALSPFDAPHGNWMVYGLSPHMDDLFRLAGLGSRMIGRTAGRSAPALALEAEVETAS